MENGQLGALDAAVAGPVPEECFVTPDDVEQYWGDVNGGFLPPDRVREARQLELAYLRKQEVYEKVPLEECLRDTNGRGPITTRWIDTSKGDPTNPNFRSRLVVREIEARKRPEERIFQNMLFSSTPAFGPQSGYLSEDDLLRSDYGISQKPTSMVCRRGAYT